MRGATLALSLFLSAVDISIHAPLAGRDRFRISSSLSARISIHAPLAGRDRGEYLGEAISEISIHAPLAGRDLWRSDAGRNSP